METNKKLNVNRNRKDLRDEDPNQASLRPRHLLQARRKTDRSAQKIRRDTTAHQTGLRRALRVAAISVLRDSYRL